MKDLRRYRSLLAAMALVVFAGCPKPPPTPSAPAAPVTPLRVMVVDDAPLGAALAREWLAHTESPIELVEVTADKAAAAGQLPVDVVIYPPAMLGQFASADLLLPLDENALSDPAYARDEILPVLKSLETTWGRRTVAVPLGSPQLVLWYRADLLALNNLQPPRTWEEYAAVVKKFADKPADTKPEVESWQATAEPLAAGWPGRLLLARAAASALHRDQLSPLWNLEKLEPLIAGPPFVRALEQLVADNRSSGELQLLTPVQCFEKFHAGECAFAIGWPGNTEKVPARLQADQIGIMQLPGSAEAFQSALGKWEPVAADESIQVPLLSSSGRVASVTRASAQPKVATQFLLWLSGPHVSGRVAAVSSATTVFRTSHFRNSGSWQAPTGVQSRLPAYGELLFAQPEAGRRFSLPRIPGEHEYLAALDAAVLSAVQGDKPAAAALESAADAWREITNRRGVTLQQRALRRSLGLGD